MDPSLQSTLYGLLMGITMTVNVGENVTRTCPEHVFKGGRDPRLGPPADQLPQGTPTTTTTGVTCK